jgi:hypothetical protein
MGGLGEKGWGWGGGGSGGRNIKGATSSANIANSREEGGGAKKELVQPGR